MPPLYNVRPHRKKGFTGAKGLGHDKKIGFEREIMDGSRVAMGRICGCVGTGKKAFVILTLAALVAGSTASAQVWLNVKYFGLRSEFRP